MVLLGISLDEGNMSGTPVRQPSHEAAAPERSTSKSRSETPPATSSVAFKTQFAFVDGLNSRQGAGRKETRSFVTKQHYRKKWFEMGKDGADGARQNSQAEPLDSRAPVHGKVIFWDSNEEQRQPVPSSEVGLARGLGGGRIDPFDSYPIPATRDVHELVDHCEFGYCP